MEIKNDDVMTITVPDSWNELLKMKREKALMAYHVIMQDVEGDIPPSVELQMKRIEVLKILTGWNQKDFDALRLSMNIDNSDEGVNLFIGMIEKLSQQATKPFFNVQTDENGNEIYDIAYEMTDCPFPIIEYTGIANKKFKLFACKGSFENASFEEFMTLMTGLENYQKTNDLKHIEKILGTIYRHPKQATKENIANNYDGDIRIELNDATVDMKAKHFAKIHPDAKKWLLFWLMSCRQRFINDYKELFNGEDGKGLNMGWAGVLTSLSNFDITKQPAIKKELADNVLVNMLAMERQRKLLKDAA